MKRPTKLEFGKYYHIYHRGNNREPIFFEKRNYLYFLKLYGRYIVPVAHTLAYCLMNNHFHFLIQTKTEPQISDFLKKSDISSGQIIEPSEQFRRLFISYTKAINKAYGRTGSLFENKFGRIEVKNDRYLCNLIQYIHHNPQKHGFVNDFRDWPYSSYDAILSETPTRVERTAVLDWFGGADGFVDALQTPPDEQSIAHLLTDYE
jgi:REP element-mobilizing transposase RayT